MSDVEIGGSGVTVTLKAGKGFEAPWIGLRGTPAEVFKMLAETVVPGEEVSNLTLAELTNYAAQRFQSVGNVQSKLGGVILPGQTGSPDALPENAGAPWGAEKPDPWDGIGERPKGTQTAKETPPADPLIAQIQAITNLDDLQALFLKNKEAFERDEVKQAVAKQRAEHQF